MFQALLVQKSGKSQALGGSDQNTLPNAKSWGKKKKKVKRRKREGEKKEKEREKKEGIKQQEFLSKEGLTNFLPGVSPKAATMAKY